jgi:hypothetical protein
VILGGLHVQACPDECAPHADALALGEGVELWPVILDDLRHGRLRPRYQGSYRGCFDTVQQEHSAGDKVYIISVGASAADGYFPTSDDVEIKLLPQSFNSTLLIGSATLLALKMDLKAPRPLAPSAIKYNGDGNLYQTPDLEGQGAGPQDYGLSVEWNRRTHAHYDEVLNATTDITPFTGTEYQVEVRHTPFSASDVAVVTAWSGDDETSTDDSIGDILRNDILAGSPNTDINVVYQFRIRSRHTLYGQLPDHQCIQETEHLVTPTTALIGQVAMGQVAWGTELPVSYAAVSTSTHNVTLGVAFTLGNVEYRLNAGAWTNVITAGGTTGGFAVTALDVIELRHTANDGAQTNFVELDDAGTPVAYGMFIS